MWLLLGYPSNIHGYPSKYWNYTSRKKLGFFFLLLLFYPSSQKILLNIKGAEFNFRMGCILVLFLFLWIINVQLRNFRFLNFEFFYFRIQWYWLTLIPNCHFYDWNFSKTTFTYKILDEITLTHTGWAWKVQNFIFAISRSPKIHRIHKHSNTCEVLNFHLKLIFFFEMLVTLYSIRFNNNWNNQKLLITVVPSPLPCKWHDWVIMTIPTYTTTEMKINLVNGMIEWLQLSLLIPL